MQKTIDETNYRREKQTAYNLANNLVPKALNKSLDNALAKNSVQTYVQERENRKAAEAENRYKTQDEIEKELRDLRKAMEKAAKELDFIQAAQYRDEIEKLKAQINS
jgi:excinuclease ABC subunit B